MDSRSYATDKPPEFAVANRAQIENLESHYRSGDSDLGRDFFLPCLACCSSYRRAVGYFSSTALASWAQVLPKLAKTEDVKVHLLASPNLSEEDRAVLKRTADATERDRILQDLADRVVVDAYAFADDPANTDLRLELFSWMVARGQLELRFAFPVHVEDPSIFHEKIGVFIFPWGANLAFTGSANETISGHRRNYESIDVFRDWVPSDHERVAVKISQFEEAWRNEAKGLKTLELSAKTLALIRTRAPEEPPFAGGATGVASSPEAYPVDSRWRHQDEAIEEFLKARHGILQMATGTGKTRTAIRIVEGLIKAKEVDTVIIAADGNDLLDQWSKQLFAVAERQAAPFRVLRHYEQHHDQGEYVLDPLHSILVCSRGTAPAVLKRLSRRFKSRLIMVQDEVHSLGSAANVKNYGTLTKEIAYTLGLSATPDREYDEEGNVFIERAIGPVIYEFGLEDAIERGVLCEFDYYPIEYLPSQDDKRRLKAVYLQKAARAREGKPMSDAEVYTQLARVYKTSKVKLPLFEAHLEGHPDTLDRCIIFVAETKYGQDVQEIVHGHRYEYHTYYADDERSHLVEFAKGNTTCLITCHRISQGIDIRSIGSIVLFACDRARLETIQRIGRCLRVDPDKPDKRAQSLTSCASTIPSRPRRTRIRSVANGFRPFLLCGGPSNAARPDSCRGVTPCCQ